MTSAHDEQSDEYLNTHTKLEHDNESCHAATQAITDSPAAQLISSAAGSDCRIVIVVAAALVTGSGNDKRVLIAQRTSPPGTSMLH